MQKVKVGDVYDVAISHGEGRFVCDDENLYKNVDGNYDIKIFKSGVEYLNKAPKGV